MSDSDDNLALRKLIAALRDEGRSHKEIDYIVAGVSTQRDLIIDIVQTVLKRNGIDWKPYDDVTKWIERDKGPKSYSSNGFRNHIISEIIDRIQEGTFPVSDRVRSSPYWKPKVYAQKILSERLCKDKRLGYTKLWGKF